jgi:hypothetical protein
MADDDDKPTADDPKGWYTPREARNLAARTLSLHGATAAIWDLVTGDLVKVVSTHASIRTPAGKITATKVSAVITIVRLSVHRERGRY